MHIAPVDPNTSAVSHGGERYEPDENGLFDVPAELAERLLQGPGWQVHVAAEPDPTLDLAELRAIAAKGAEAARLLAEAEAAAEADGESTPIVDLAEGVEDPELVDGLKKVEAAAQDVADGVQTLIDAADDAPAKKTRTRRPVPKTDD